MVSRPASPEDRDFINTHGLTAWHEANGTIKRAANNSLTITCTARDDKGRSLVEAKLGEMAHRHRFDTDSQFHRRQFREAVVSKFNLNDDAHEFVETQLMAAAESRLAEPIYKPVIKLLSAVEPTTVQWLWMPRLVIGKINLLAGDPGLGKSLMAIDIAARVSRGAGFPDSPNEKHKPGGVVILTTEDDADDAIVPRAIAHGADLSRIAHVEGMTETDGDGSVVRGIDLTRDLEVIGAAMQQVPRCRLLVIDTLNAYLGKTDSHKSPEVNAMMTPLKQFARDRGVAVLALSHFRKGDGRAVQQVMGSMAFVGCSRTAWAVTRCPTNKRRRLLTCIKNNYGDDTSGLAYAIEPHGPNGEPVICWEAEPVRISADEAMAATQKKRGPEPKEREDAATWLHQQLCRGTRLAGEVLSDAEAMGYSSSTVRRAFKQLECQRKKNGFADGWLWSLPEDATEHHTPDNLAPSHLRENTEGNTTEHINKYSSCEKVSGNGSVDPRIATEEYGYEFDSTLGVPF